MATLAAFDPQAPAHRAAAAALHDRLSAIGFGAEIAGLRPSRTAYYDTFVLAPDGAGNAVRFFVLHQLQTGAQLRAWLGADLVDFLTEMAAIVPAGDGWRSVISATWFAGRLIFADARAYNAVWPAAPFADYVMPPGGDSVGLERVAPHAPRQATLDVCCGAGAQTLAAATYSERVTGVDLNPRALRFARFNAAVNRIEQATFVRGDLYAPLGDARFDAILANPPFVPWPSGDDELLYRGGGALGDEVLARILAGAVAHLEPLGSLTIVADFANVATLAARIGRWQGQARRTLILLQHHHELLDYAETHAAHLDSSAERQAEAVRLLQHYQAAGITSLDFGYIVQDGLAGPVQLQRTAAMLDGAIGDDVAAWFAHQQRLAGPVSDALLQVAPGLRLVEVAEQTAGKPAVASCYAAPGPNSLHEASPVSSEAFALLRRVAAGGLRVGAVTEPAAARELAALLARGLVRLQP